MKTRGGNINILHFFFKLPLISEDSGFSRRQSEQLMAWTVYTHYIQAENLFASHSMFSLMLWKKRDKLSEVILILILSDFWNAHHSPLSAEGDAERAYSDQTPEFRNVTLTYCLKLGNESDCNQTAVVVDSALPQDIKHRKLYPMIQCMLMLMHNVFSSYFVQFNLKCL